MDNVVGVVGAASAIIGGILGVLGNKFLRNDGNTVITIVDSQTNMLISTWKYQIDNATEIPVYAPSRAFLTRRITDKLVTIWTDKHDTVELNMNLVDKKLIALVVKLAPNADTLLDDRTHLGVAKYKNGNIDLWYLQTSELGGRIKTDAGRYAHNTQSPDGAATIGFAINENDSGNIFDFARIKKRKKNTQVDVYLDDNQPIDG